MVRQSMTRRHSLRRALSLKALHFASVSGPSKLSGGATAGSLFFLFFLSFLSFLSLILAPNCCEDDLFLGSPSRFSWRFAFLVPQPASEPVSQVGNHDQAEAVVVPFEEAVPLTQVVALFLRAGLGA